VQILVPPVVPARSSWVSTASIRTTAGAVRRKCTIAASRKPSPFGLTVVSSRRSPANGADPFVTRTSTRLGEGADATAAATKGAITRPTLEPWTRGLRALTVSLPSAQPPHTQTIDTDDR